MSRETEWAWWAGREEREQEVALCEWLSGGRAIPDPVTADSVREHGCPLCGKSRSEHCQGEGPL